MGPLRIAIVGAGTAGLAAAILLHKSGHSVTVHEKFAAPQPLGAGLLLQPTGLAVLNKLGLDKDIIQSGSIINRLYGKVCGHRLATLDIRYKCFKDHYFGVGTHRGDLFTILHKEAIRQGISFMTSHDIPAIETTHDTSVLVSTDGTRSEVYDLIVDCSGAKSRLRQKYADIRLNKPYPYGALWGTVEIDDNHSMRLDTLDQRYKNAYHMIGILPVGRNKNNTATRAAMFWSMRLTDYPEWRSNGLQQWKNYVANLWPEITPLLGQFKTHDDLTLATYSDVILRSYHTGNIVFIGDAAHCTSPQLGQGANMALVDACILDNCITRANSLSEALQLYSKRRKPHLRLYQFASRALTPFFQSDSWFFAKIRFLLCGLACRIPLTQTITARLLSGTMLGPFWSLNPGQWSADYDLCKRAVKTSIA